MLKYRNGYKFWKVIHLINDAIKAKHNIVDRLREEEDISLNELRVILEDGTSEVLDYLMRAARSVADDVYGKDIYIRGLVEFTNYCKNDCYYCGIRCSNSEVKRYRLTREEILECAAAGYDLGFRTIVLQGGEDYSYSDEEICNIVSSIKRAHEDMAVTLSIGERNRSSYEAYFDAGADRYLLRHETASKEHYSKLHPSSLSLENRIKCLQDLKEIGYQVGCGFMVGSPYQTYENIYEDLRFIKSFKPHMVGIGPFVSHHNTPFRDMKSGSLDMTLKLLAIIRLMNPKVLLPATTALGTIDSKGREKGILAGANVLMPNLSPGANRKDYQLYDNKICTGDEAAECVACLSGRIETIGYHIVADRGDSKVAL